MTLLLYSLRTKDQIVTDDCRIREYRDMEIWIPAEETADEEEAERMLEMLVEDSGIVWTKEVCLERTEGKCSSIEEVKAFLYTALQEEIRYEQLQAKREGVLNALLKRTTWKTEVSDQEEAVLLAVYEKEQMSLSAEELAEGRAQLCNVYGAESSEQLKEYLSETQQTEIIKKEKVYEYLLENNTFLSLGSHTGKQ